MEKQLQNGYILINCINVQSVGTFCEKLLFLDKEPTGPAGGLEAYVAHRKRRKQIFVRKRGLGELLPSPLEDCANGQMQRMVKPFVLVRRDRPTVYQGRFSCVFPASSQGASSAPSGVPKCAAPPWGIPSSFQKNSAQPRASKSPPMMKA